MSSVAELKEALKVHQAQLQEHYELVGGFEAEENPDEASAEALNYLRNEEIPNTEAAIADTKAKLAEAEAAAAASPQAPKWDPTKHPKFRAVTSDAAPPPPEEGPVVFNVKDVVNAKWSGDGGFYEATIIDRTGSSSDPVYTVRFHYDNLKETKRKHQIRPVAGSKKRKAEADPIVETALPPPPPPAVVGAQDGSSITRAPQIDRSLLQERSGHVSSKTSDGPPRLQLQNKKPKSTGRLEKSKSNWQNFQMGGGKKGMPKPKDSQFRTPDAPTASVVSSGKPMTRDPQRTRYKANGAFDGQDDEEA